MEKKKLKKRKLEKNARPPPPKGGAIFFYGNVPRENLKILDGRITSARAQRMILVYLFGKWAEPLSSEVGGRARARAR